MRINLQIHSEDENGKKSVIPVTKSQYKIVQSLSKIPGGMRILVDVAEAPRNNAEALAFYLVERGYTVPNEEALAFYLVERGYTVPNERAQEDFQPEQIIPEPEPREPAQRELPLESSVPARKVLKSPRPVSADDTKIKAPENFERNLEPSQPRSKMIQYPVSYLRSDAFLGHWKKVPGGYILTEEGLHNTLNGPISIDSITRIPFRNRNPKSLPASYYMKVFRCTLADWLPLAPYLRAMGLLQQHSARNRDMTPYHVEEILEGWKDSLR